MSVQCASHHEVNRIHLLSSADQNISHGYHLIQFYKNLSLTSCIMGRYHVTGLGVNEMIITKLILQINMDWI
jgi:hypothetical protein